jgi:hypothetical protein
MNLLGPKRGNTAGMGENFKRGTRSGVSSNPTAKDELKDNYSCQPTLAFFYPKGPIVLQHILQHAWGKAQSAATLFG